MTRFARLAAGCLAAGLMVAPRPAGADEVRDAVEAGNRAFIAAFLRGDARAVADLYTEDARVIAPATAPASGRAAIEVFWRGMIEKGFQDLTLVTEHVEAAGDLAFEDGTVSLVAADGTIGESRYVVVWKRMGGRWKLHRDIWN